MPGSPRVQPVVAASDGKLYVFGGFAGRTPKAEPTVSTDGLCYSTPRKTNGAPWVVPPELDGKPLALGGVLLPHCPTATYLP